MYCNEEMRTYVYTTMCTCTHISLRMYVYKCGECNYAIKYRDFINLINLKKQHNAIIYHWEEF